MPKDKTEKENGEQEELQDVVYEFINYLRGRDILSPHISDR